MILHVTEAVFMHLTRYDGKVTGKVSGVRRYVSSWHGDSICFAVSWTAKNIAINFTTNL